MSETPLTDHAYKARGEVLLQERYVRRKLREKEYADKKRHTFTSDIREEDMVLLRQN